MLSHAGFPAIAILDPIETRPKDIVNNEKSSSKITTQSLINLFRKAIRSGHEEILSWIRYSDNFENKVIEIRHKTGVSDKTARKANIQRDVRTSTRCYQLPCESRLLGSEKFVSYLGTTELELIS